MADDSEVRSRTSEQPDLDALEGQARAAGITTEQALALVRYARKLEAERNGLRRELDAWAGVSRDG